MGTPASTLANWRRRRSLPYTVCVRAAQERGINLDWLILGKEGSGLDTSALALAAYHSRDALPLLELGEVEAGVLGEAIAKWYGEYTDSLDRIVATGRTRERAARLIFDALAKSPRTDVIAEVIELQSQQRPSGTSESSHAAPGAPIEQEFLQSPETSTEGPEHSVEQESTPEQSRSATDGSNEQAGQVFGERGRIGGPIPIEPGPEHLSPDKFRTLRELIREVADPHIAEGWDRSAAIWHARKPLLKEFDVVSDRLIPKEFGDRAIALMEERAAELRSRPNEADYAPWRTERYVIINRQARRLGYSRDKLHAVAFDHFGECITTLKQLSDQNLRQFCDILLAEKPQNPA